MAEEQLVLSIKNPGRPTAEDFRLALPPSATVRQLKEALQQGYPGNPAPATVTVSRVAGAPGPRPRRRRHLAAAVLLRRLPSADHPTACRLQAIYAGRVLKDDNAVLSTFIVPVRRLPAMAVALHPALPPPPLFNVHRASHACSQCHHRTRTPRCRSRCTL